MAKLVAANNLLTRDANGYATSGIGSWDNNYQALASTTRIVDGSPYLYLSGDDRSATFGWSAPASPGPFTQLVVLATVRVLSGSVPAWAALQMRDAVTGQVYQDRFWNLPADGVYRNISVTWTTNPMSGRAWDRDQIGSDRYRFGIARVPAFGPIRVTRLYVEPT